MKLAAVSCDVASWRKFYCWFRVSTHACSQGNRATKVVLDRGVTSIFLALYRQPCSQGCVQGAIVCFHGCSRVVADMCSTLPNVSICSQMRSVAGCLEWCGGCVQYPVPGVSICSQMRNKTTFGSICSIYPYVR
eukprot:1146774-Pelagomonas_calceolata.AAC.1